MKSTYVFNPKTDKIEWRNPTSLDKLTLRQFVPHNVTPNPETVEDGSSWDLLSQILIAEYAQRMHANDLEDFDPLDRASPRDHAKQPENN